MSLRYAGFALAPAGGYGSSASYLGLLGGGSSASGWKITWAGIRVASLGRVFFLPLVISALCTSKKLK